MASESNHYYFTCYLSVYGGISLFLFYLEVLELLYFLGLVYMAMEFYGQRL